MIKPVININGSSRDDLIKPRRAAVDALHDAITLLREAMPNGRDYPNDLRQCMIDRQVQHDRISVLQELREELFEEALLIQRWNEMFGTQGEAE